MVRVYEVAEVAALQRSVGVPATQPPLAGLDKLRLPTAQAVRTFALKLAAQIVTPRTQALVRIMPSRVALLVGKPLELQLLSPWISSPSFRVLLAYRVNGIAPGAAAAEKFLAANRQAV
jgi:hypothetical protein